MPKIQLDKIYANEGEKIAENVTFEAFLDADYGESHSEWVDGDVYQMTTVEIEHAYCFQFLSHLIQIFLELNGGGRMLSRAVLMYSDKARIARSPDIQVLLPEHLDQVKQYYVMGPSDLVVEIIAEGSERLRSSSNTKKQVCQNTGLLTTSIVKHFFINLMIMVCIKDINQMKINVIIVVFCADYG